MSKWKFIYLKNRMIVANAMANMIGVFVEMVLLARAEFQMSVEVADIKKNIDSFFLPISFFLVGAISIRYERPIRQYLNRLYRNEPIPEALTEQTRRRLLNEPFVLIAIDLGIWILAALIYGGIFKRVNIGSDVIQHAFLGSIATGLITVTVAFFAFEFLLQRVMVPHIFPNGGLYATPKTLRIRIHTRLIAFLFACNLIPFFTIFHVFKRSYETMYSPFETMERLYSAIQMNAFVFMSVAVWLTFLISSNLTRPFAEIIHVLKGVRRGNFNRRVRVTSNDEIGYTGDVINQMTEGLREREQMRQSLNLAKEVQQNLLPKADPEVNGLDIAGKSIYCDETGGDYFDFLYPDAEDNGCMGVIVGDVSDHGICSALLMATVRASIRQRCAAPGEINEIVTDVNRQISKDVAETGQFMTLFYLSIDLNDKSLQWVRAGHDPAILYDPESNRFEELWGAGVALGLDEAWRYEAGKKKTLREGQVIVIGTDGIWEARRANGDMFGKERIRDILTCHGHERAKDILTVILEGLSRFRAGEDLEDDVTLIVLKVNGDVASKD